MDDKLSGEEKRIALLKSVRVYDVYTNPDPMAIYTMELTPSAWFLHHRQPRLEWLQLQPSDFIGFSIHCTPTDTPEDNLWKKLKSSDYWAIQDKLKTAFRLVKSSMGLAECHWVFSEKNNDIVALGVRTNAYSLGLSQAKRYNRIVDIAWAKNKVAWIWKHALPNIPLPKISVIAPVVTDGEDHDLYDFIRHS